MTKSRYPVEAFGPELLALLLKAGREPVRIESDYKTLNHLRARLGALKVRMRATNHPMAAIAARARFSILFGEKAGLAAIEMIKYKNSAVRPKDKTCPAVLLGQPYDSEFKELLTKSGITVPELDSDPLDVMPEGQPRNAKDLLDDILGDIDK